MSKKKRAVKKQVQLEGDKIIKDFSGKRTFNRGNFMLLVAIMWMIGLFLIVARYGNIW